MANSYLVHCECGAVRLQLTGAPRVKGYCHCEDCRDLLDVPFHSVTAWNKDQLTIVSVDDRISEYKHPRLEMKRAYCTQCGETLYNTNAMDWRVVSQLLISKCYDNELPEELHSDSHFFYDRRIVNIDDDLPKYD